MCSSRCLPSLWGCLLLLPSLLRVFSERRERLLEVLLLLDRELSDDSLGSPSVSSVSSLNRFLIEQLFQLHVIDCTERRELSILTVETSCFNPAKEVCSPLSKDTMVSMSGGSPSSGFLAMESPALVVEGWLAGLVADGQRMVLVAGERRRLAKQSRQRVGGGGLQVAED
jgi:hypothetical protein